MRRAIAYLSNHHLCDVACCVVREREEVGTTSSNNPVEEEGGGGNRIWCHNGRAAPATGVGVVVGLLLCAT